MKITKITKTLLKEMVTEAFKATLKEEYDESQVDKIASMLCSFEDDTISSAIEMMQVLDMGMLYEKIVDDKYVTAFMIVFEVDSPVPKVVEQLLKKDHRYEGNDTGAETYRRILKDYSASRFYPDETSTSDMLRVSYNSTDNEGNPAIKMIIQLPKES